MKGRDLYYDFYKPEDHEDLSKFVQSGIARQRWIVSYDNAPAIRALYSESPHIIYDIGYSARSASRGSEVMFFGDGLKVPPLVGSITLTGWAPATELYCEWKAAMAVENLVEVIRSLSPEEQESVIEFVEFLKRRGPSPSSPFLSAVDEFIGQHSDLLRRLAQ